MKTDDRVTGDAGGIPITGTILGLASDCGVRMWIVQLDQPIHRYEPKAPDCDADGKVTWRALVLPEGVLKRACSKCGRSPGADKDCL